MERVKNFIVVPILPERASRRRRPSGCNIEDPAEVRRMANEGVDNIHCCPAFGGTLNLAANHTSHMARVLGLASLRFGEAGQI